MHETVNPLISLNLIEQYINFALIKVKISLWLITNIKAEILPHYAIPMMAVHFIKSFFYML